MFKSDASLFLSASNNLGFAKTYINECKRLISEFELSDNNDCTVLKESLNNCDIDTLVTKVDTTKQSLMQIDQDFATKYMSLLKEQIQNETLDTSKMTPEELQAYNTKMDVYERDYHQNLLCILEGYEEQGLLTDEMKEVLEYERLVVERYGVQDEMAVVNSTTDKYLELFKKYSELDRKIISANPDLSQDEKTALLSSYDEAYNTRLGEIQSGIDARQKSENDYAELQDLYRQKEENDDFWHPIIEGELQDAIIAKKIEMGIATESEVEYSNMGDWDKFWANTGTFVASTYTGLFKFTESMADGAVMLAGGVGSLFGADTQWAEDFVKTDYASGLYEGIQLSTGMNSVVANGSAHTYGEAFGTAVGYIAASYAAPWATATMTGLASMGSTSEKALHNGASFGEAFGVGTVAGVAGAASGGALSKFNAFAGANTTSLLQVGRNALIGGAISSTEPIVNTVAEYGFYAKNMVDENGNPKYDNLWDYYVKGGGLQGTAMAFGSGFVSSGIASGVGLKKINDVYKSPEFQNRSNGYQWFEDNCTNVKTVKEALTEHYAFLKSKGYKGSYLQFVSEYASGTFTAPTGFSALEAEVRETGAVTVLDGDGLRNVSKYGSLGRGADGSKKGASFATSGTAQAELEARLSSQGASSIPVEERAAKGITTAKPQNGYYKLEYTPQFFEENPQARIYPNSGQNGINGASDAAMPGGYTYDLHSAGNGVPEVCVGDLKLNDAVRSKINWYITSGSTAPLDLGRYDRHLKGIVVTRVQ